MSRFTAVLLVLFSAAAAADPVPAPPTLAAKSYVLLDFASGQLLAQAGGDTRVDPASLTKLMTAYVTFDELKKGHIKRDDQVLISERAWRQGYSSNESRMFIRVGTRVSVNDLLQGMIVVSGNDASVALAEHVGGTEEVFADLMNQAARAVGLTGTHYTNATGVPDPQEYTTARDIAVLSRALIRDFPEDYALFHQHDYTYANIHQPNRNLLLGLDPTVDGIKTGHTEAAGYCLAASAQRDGRRLIAVVMGTDSTNARAQAALALLNYGFRFFESRQLAAARQALAKVRIWKGDQLEVPLGIATTLNVALPRGAADAVQLKPEVAGPVYAPVQAGQVLGKLHVIADGRELRVEPLIALQPVPEGSWWRKLSDEIRIYLGQTS